MYKCPVVILFSVVCCYIDLKLNTEYGIGIGIVWHVGKLAAATVPHCHSRLLKWEPARREFSCGYPTARDPVFYVQINIFNGYLVYYLEVLKFKVMSDIRIRIICLQLFKRFHF